MPELRLADAWWLHLVPEHSEQEQLWTEEFKSVRVALCHCPPKLGSFDVDGI
jgi:hypothetical protein